MGVLFIIGNGFDLEHGMPTLYGDFRRWLIENKRIDVIQELQSAFPARIKEDYLLWCDFEKALGEYDLEAVLNWSLESLYLTDYSLGNQFFNNGLIDTQLPDIIDEAFTNWVRSIPMPAKTKYENLGKDSLYLTFNYTDTLERLYSIPEQQVLHIHGRASKGERLIVGHDRTIGPADYWDETLDVRENNERMQRLMDMNALCKPFSDIIQRNASFFRKLNTIEDIYVIGHSCCAIDYPYFIKVKASVPKGVKWHFNPFDEATEIRVAELKKRIGIADK